jgi:hypothetical protein
MTKSRVDMLRSAVDAAVETKESKLSNEILSLSGYSGKEYKRFANRLLANPFIKSYLEIGIFKGSTAIPTLFGNYQRLNYTLIDNFFLGGDSVRSEFLTNWKTHIDTEPNLIDADCFSIDPNSHGLQNIDVYFYDGEHKEEDHYKALTHYYNSMAESFILMVDDWGWSQVKDGTYRAITHLNLKIDHKVEFTGTSDSDGWWNGCGVFVLRKTT